MDQRNPTDNALNGGSDRASGELIGGSTFSAHPGVPSSFLWSMRDVYWALCRYRRRGFLFFSGTIILVLVGLIVCPRVYTSEAKLFVRLGRENASLDPTATTGKVVGINVTREYEIKSIVEVMSSRELTERVAEKIGLDPPVTSELEREKAITSLMDDIQIWSPRQTTVISIECKAKSPARARDITKSLVEVYLEEHVRLNRTPRAHEFFEDQTNLLRDELAVASQDLRDAKNRFKLASIEGRRDALQAQTSSVETQQIETTSAMTTIRAKINAQRESFNRLPELMLKHIAGQSVAATAMQQKLHELQTLEQALLARFSPLHPDIVAIRGQVQEAKRLLLATLPDRQQAVTGALLKDESEYTSLQARQQTLNQLLSQLHVKLSVLNEQEIEIKRLERRVKVVGTNYLTYSASLEETRVDQALQEAQISNISVVQPATLRRKPTSPKKGLTLALTLVVATVGAFAVSLLSAQLDQSLKTREDVECWLNAPLLVSIPRTNPNSMTIAHILSGTTTR